VLPRTPAKAWSSCRSAHNAPAANTLAHDSSLRRRPRRP